MITVGKRKYKIAEKSLNRGKYKNRISPLKVYYKSLSDSN